MHNIHNTEPNCQSRQKIARFDFCLVDFQRKPGFIHPDHIQMNILKPTVFGPCKNLLILPKNLPEDVNAYLRERRLTNYCRSLGYLGENSYTFTFGYPRQWGAWGGGVSEKTWDGLGLGEKTCLFWVFLERSQSLKGCLVHFFNIAS